MNSQIPIKIKEEKIDLEYDRQSQEYESKSDDLPMPIIQPKKEPTTNDSTNRQESNFEPLAGGFIKIKLEPKDNSEISKSTENEEVALPLPLISVVKTEKLKKLDSTLINNFLDNLDDSLLEDLENIENDAYNTISGNDKLNIGEEEEGEIIENDSDSIVSNVDVDIKDLQKQIKKHKQKIEKHKKHKRNKELNVKKEKKTKRSYNKSDSDNSNSGSPSRRSSKKKKKLIKCDSPTSDSINVIPLVRDYNHRSVSENVTQSASNAISLPKPTIVKVEPHLLLPKPIDQKETDKTFKRIKLENPNSSSTATPIHKDKVLKRCSQIINNIETYAKNKYSTRIFHTSTNFIPPINSSDIENRSPLLCLKNVQFKFSSSSKINYKDFGIVSPPETIGNLARIIGFETGQLIDLITSKVNSLNVKSDNDINKSFLNNVSPFSSFYTNVSTQTDQLPCDECVTRQLRKRNDISVQAVASMNEIAVQTEQEDELPMIKEFHTLNMNQQLALNDFYSIIISGQPANANDKLKLRDRLVQIYDMANQQIINPVPSIAPPPPVILPNPYNSVLTQPQLGYPGQLSTATAHTQQMFDQYYQQPAQQMGLHNYQQQQVMHLNSQQISRNQIINDPRNNLLNDPRNNTNDPRNSSRYNFDNYIRDNNSKRY